MPNKSSETPILIDIANLATLLRISPKTARRLVRDDKFPPPVRLRGCVRWWKTDVLAHLRELTEPKVPDESEGGG